MRIQKSALEDQKKKYRIDMEEAAKLQKKMNQLEMCVIACKKDKERMQQGLKQAQSQVEKLTKETTVFEQV